MKRGRRSTRGMLREEVTGIHWRIDGGRSHHYYQRNHQSDQTRGYQRPQHSSKQILSAGDVDQNIIFV